MPSFSTRSKEKLASVHPDLQRLCYEAIKHYDFMVVTGHRGEAEQNDCFLRGTSKLKWPHSRHNKDPSEAVDLAPYPVDWYDPKRFYFLAGLMLGLASQMGIDVEWGGECFAKFKDLPHFQLRLRR